MRFLGRGLIGLLLFSLALGLLGLAGNTIKIAVQDRVNKEPRAQKARERTFTVKVVPAEITSMNPTMNAFGEIQSRKTLDLRMAAGGQIQELSTNFVEGGSVKSGELLIRLDDSNYQSAVDLAKNNLIDAENEVSESGRILSFSKEELAAAEEQEELRLRALTAFKTLPKPLLFHCKSGADRAGFTAAMYLMVCEGRPVADAKKQLGLRYIHLDFTATGVLDYILAVYEARVEQHPIDFEDWIRREYHQKLLQQGFNMRRPLSETLDLIAQSP